MQRIADIRTSPDSLDCAKALFDRLARNTITLAAADAAFERRIATLKAEHERDTLGRRSDITEDSTALSCFILSHKDAFADPRKVQTSFGSFGLQAVSEIQIEDEDACMKSLVKQRLEMCFQVATRPIKRAIEKALRAGARIAGVRLIEGDTAVYKVEKTLLDEARKG